MNATLLEQILDSNRSFLAGNPKSLDESGPYFLIIACTDPRLTGLLVPAMGLPRHRAMIIRISGNRILSSSADIQRSVGAALFLRGVRDIFVLGHTDCAMASFSAPSVIESFRAAGIPRSAFGDGDIREWFGAFTDIKGNVLESIGNLGNSGIIPSECRIHGLIIDTVTGRLEVIRNGYQEKIVLSSSAPEHAVEHTSPSAATNAAPTIRPAAVGQTRQEKQAQSAEEPKSPKGPIVIPAVPALGEGKAKQPASTAEAIAILEDFFKRERQNPKLRADIARLKGILASERNPFQVLTAVAGVVNANADRYPRVPGAVEYLAAHLDKNSVLEPAFLRLLNQFMHTL